MKHLCLLIFLISCCTSAIAQQPEKFELSLGSFNPVAGFQSTFKEALRIPMAKDILEPTLDLPSYYQFSPFVSFVYHLPTKAGAKFHYALESSFNYLPNRYRVDGFTYNYADTSAKFGMLLPPNYYTITFSGLMAWQPSPNWRYCFGPELVFVGREHITLIQDKLPPLNYNPNLDKTPNLGFQVSASRTVLRQPGFSVPLSLRFRYLPGALGEFSFDQNSQALQVGLTAGILFGTRGE
jgi:hypothetical protein